MSLNSPEQYMKLNVGGCLYQATIDTLTRGDTMLSSMFSGRMDVLRNARVNVKIRVKKILCDTEL